MRVVVCLTTIPSRIRYLPHVFEQIRSQTYSIDQVYLHLPKWSKREKREYPSLPNEISLENLTIVRCNDYGPITKLYPVLDHERHPDTIIVTIDDDVEYYPDLIKDFVHYCELYPNSAIGGSGYIIGSWYNFMGKVYPKEVIPVSVIEGLSGCAYRRRFFKSDLIDYKDAPRGAFYHDDLWISGYLSLNGIQRLVRPGPPAKTKISHQALSANKLTFSLKFLSVVIYLKRKGAFDEIQTAPFYLRFGTYIILGLILVLILICYYI